MGEQQTQQPTNYNERIPAKTWPYLMAIACAAIVWVEKSTIDKDQKIYDLQKEKDALYEKLAAEKESKAQIVIEANRNLKWQLKTNERVIQLTDMDTVGIANGKPSKRWVIPTNEDNTD